jgi:hypothetical protein
VVALDLELLRLIAPASIWESRTTASWEMTIDRTSSDKVRGVVSVAHRPPRALDINGRFASTKLQHMRLSGGLLSVIALHQAVTGGVGES